MSTVIPILRIYDYNKTIEFYVNWLGFKIDWEHRFEPNTPVFMQVSKGDIVLNLSEHHGDGSPNGRVRILNFKGCAIIIKASLIHTINTTALDWKFPSGTLQPLT